MVAHVVMDVPTKEKTTHQGAMSYGGSRPGLL